MHVQDAESLASGLAVQWLSDSRGHASMAIHVYALSGFTGGDVNDCHFVVLTTRGRGL